MKDNNKDHAYGATRAVEFQCTIWNLCLRPPSIYLRYSTDHSTFWLAGLPDFYLPCSDILGVRERLKESDFTELWRVDDDRVSAQSSFWRRHCAHTSDLHTKVATTCEYATVRVYEAKSLRTV